jgi:tetratricopeptide (TPR) repeat protein
LVQISQRLLSDSERRQHWEILTFRLCMWAVVFCSFGAIATKAFVAKPSSVPFHYFLILVLVAAFLATFAPTLGEYASSRLHKVKFGGFEVELKDAADAAILHLTIPEAPDLGTSVTELGDGPPADSPFPSIKLSLPAIYEYEKLSLRLYLLFDQVKDPNQLDLAARENFRKLILYVGKAANAMEHHTKSLDILLWLNRFSDRELNHEELRMLGTAYLWAADEQVEKSRQISHQHEAIPLLKAAIVKHPYQTVVHYNLGWALLSLKKYPNGIRRMRKCIRLEPRCIPFAKWNIACGLKRLDRQEDALRTLEEIPPGPWWDGIIRDDWFKDPEQTTFMNRFQALSKKKIKPPNANPRPDMFC